MPFALHRIAPDAPGPDRGNTRAPPSVGKLLLLIAADPASVLHQPAFVRSLFGLEAQRSMPAHGPAQGSRGEVENSKHERLVEFLADSVVRLQIVSGYDFRGSQEMVSSEILTSDYCCCGTTSSVHFPAAVHCFSKAGQSCLSSLR